MLRTASLAVLGLALLLGSCSDSDSTGTAFIRILHNSPDAPAVDIYLSGSTIPLVAGLAYGQSTGVLETDPDDIQLALLPAGASPSANPIFVSAPIGLADNARHSLIVTGRASVANELRVQDAVNRLSSPAPGSFRARIYHAAPDAGPVGIDVMDDGTVEIASLDTFTATGSSGIDLPANTELPIGIFDAATSSRLTGFTLPAVPEGAEVIVVASGLITSERPDDADAFTLRVAIDDGSFTTVRQDPLVYIAHASPDAPAVEVRVNGGTAVPSASFGDLAGPFQTGPGSQALEILPAAGGAPVASPATPPLLAGETYLVIASGFLSPPAGGAPFQILLADDDLAEDAANQRLQALHVSPDAPAVDVGVANMGQLMTPPLISDLSFGAASLPDAGLPIAPVSTLTLGIAPTGMTATVAEFSLPIMPGLRTLALAAGALNPRAGTDAPFQLLVIDATSTPWSISAVAPNP